MNSFEKFVRVYETACFYARAGQSSSIVLTGNGPYALESQPPPGSDDYIQKRFRAKLGRIDKLLEQHREELESEIRFITSNRTREPFHQCYFRGGACVICGELFRE